MDRRYRGFLGFRVSLRTIASVGTLTFLSAAAYGQKSLDLEKLKWIHGSEPCSQNTDPALQVVQYNPTTYILRQNKCLNYEAPYLYLFIGTEKALLVDTGAEARADSFPLFETVTNLLQKKDGTSVPLIVIHSHGHGDHHAGDRQFTNKANIRLVPPVKDSIIAFFKLKPWPTAQTVFDLGKRKVTIIPIPGHDELSVAIYDHATRWLLTGDTIYPGRLYVRDGAAFHSSVARLHAFSKTNPVSYLMGNHIEMTTTPGIDYPIGTIHQPSEHALPLRLNVLEELYKSCEKMGDHIVYEVHDDFIIVPK